MQLLPALDAQIQQSFSSCQVFVTAKVREAKLPYWSTAFDGSKHSLLSLQQADYTPGQIKIKRGGPYAKNSSKM